MSPVRDSRKRGTTGLDPRKAGIGPRGGAPTFSITVRTFDNLSASLADCTVELRLASTDALIDTKSSGIGGSCIFTVADNTTQYYLKATKAGYSPVESAHTVVGGDTVDLTLTAIAVPIQEQVVSGWAHRSLWEQAIDREKRRREEEEIMVIIRTFLDVQARKRWAA